MWLGILDDISAATPNQEIVLSPSDLLILYTDGLVGVRNANGEMFGLERLIELEEQTSALPVAQIHRRILDAALSWSATQQDDLTLVVVRRNA